MISREKILGFCICLTCVLALLSAEFFARRCKQLYYLPARNFWRLDRYTNLAGQFEGKENFVLWHTGVPFNEVVVVKKPVGVTRIIVLGTSSAEGFRVSRKDNFASQLQRLLDSNYGNGKFEVINGAIGGYVSYQLLVYFQEVLLRLSPDIVILYTGGNDNFCGRSTVREYYEKTRKAFHGLGNDRTRKERLMKYGLNGLIPLYPFISESRLLGYVLIKAAENGFNNKKLMPIVDQEYVLMEFIALSRQHNFKLIFAPEISREFCERSIRLYYSLMKTAAAKERVFFLDMRPLLKEYSEDAVFLGGNDPVHLSTFGH